MTVAGRSITEFFCPLLKAKSPPLATVLIYIFLSQRLLAFLY
jgi:hypothetical protein